MKHIAIDGWTAANTTTFIGLMIYLLLKGKLRPILLDYIPIEVGHTGQAIAERVQATLTAYRIETQVGFSSLFVTQLQ